MESKENYPGSTLKGKKLLPEEQILYAPNFKEVEGHIGLGLSVRLSISLWQLRNSRTAYARILKLYMWHVHEK